MQVIDFKVYTDEVATDIQMALQRGGVVIFPTETAYGLICDATNAAAVEKIFELKGRQPTKALPVVCGSRKIVEDYFVIAPEYEELIQAYWPGPLSLVMQLKDDRICVNPEKINDNTVAVRVTSYEPLAQLSNSICIPLVATSANISGAKTPYAFADVMAPMTESIKNNIAFAIDAGDLQEIEPSTLVGLQNGKLQVYRVGPVTIVGDMVSVE